jgi:hypothetical protein
MNIPDIASYKRLYSQLTHPSIAHDECTAAVGEFSLLFEKILTSNYAEDTTICVDLLLRCLLILDANLKSAIAVTLRIWKMYIGLLKGLHGAIGPEMAEKLLGVLHSYVAGGVQSLAMAEDVAVASNMTDILLFFFQRMCASLVYLSAVVSIPSRDTAVSTMCSLRGVLESKCMSVHISAVDSAFSRLVSKSASFPLLAPALLGGESAAGGGRVSWLYGYCGLMASVLRSAGGEILPCGKIVSALREVVVGLSALSAQGGSDDGAVLSVCETAAIAYGACLDRVHAADKQNMDLEVIA